MELSCREYVYKHMILKMCIRWTIGFNRLWLPGVSFELDDDAENASYGRRGWL